MNYAPTVNRPVLPAVWKLIRLRVRITINSFRHSRLRRKFFTVLWLLALMAFAGFIFYLSWQLLGFLRSPELRRFVNFDVQPLLRSMPVLMLTGLFFGVLFTSFGVLLQALYLAGDMDFLLSSPVPMRAVFISKLLQAVLPNFGLFALFGLPILFGLGVSSNYSYAYYPFVLVVMIALTLAAAGTASLLVMAVVRVVSPRRAAEILGFIGATAGVICSQIGNLSQTFGNNSRLSPGAVSAGLAVANRLKSLWIPLNWAGQGLVDIGEGRWLPGIGLLVLTLALASLVFWFALATSERLYYNGWAGMQVIARKAKPVRKPRSVSARQDAVLSWSERLLPGPVRGILSKDFILLGRDLRNLSQLISPLVVGVVLTLSLLRGSGELSTARGHPPAWLMDSLRTLLTFGNVGVSLFVGWIMLGRLAGMSFSLEGRNFWMLKASPATSRQMLAAKFLGAYLPTALLGTVFLIGVSLLRQTAFAGWWFMLLVVLLSLAGLNGVLIGFGAAGANFRWDDPRRMNAGWLGCLGQIAAAVFLPLSLALFIAPVVLAPILHLQPAYGYLAGVVLGVSVNVIATLLPLKLAERIVQRMDEFLTRMAPHRPSMQRADGREP